MIDEHVTQTGPIRVNPVTLLEFLGKENSLLYERLLNLYMTIFLLLGVPALE